MDLVLLSLLRDGLLRRSEAAELRWSDAEFRGDGAALLHIPQSKTDQEAEGVVLYIGRAAAGALQAIRPAEESLDRNGPVFGLSSRQIGRRVQAAGLGDCFTGHSSRVGMAQDLAATGVELPALMTSGRWKSARRRTGKRWPDTTKRVGVEILVFSFPLLRPRKCYRG